MKQKARIPRRNGEFIVRINNVQRVAVVVLTALLLTGAGQVAANASDPQWETAPPTPTQP